MSTLPFRSPSVDPDPRFAYLKRSWTACHATLFPDPTFPIRRWELDVAGYLFNRDYDPVSIRLVLNHASIHGSVEACRELSFCFADRDNVERLLPERPAVEWDRPEFSGTWTSDVKEIS